MDIQKAIVLTVCLTVSILALSFMMCYVVPVNVLSVEETEEVEATYYNDTYGLEVPRKYLQMPTWRTGLPLRVNLYAGEDPVAEQIARIIMEKFPYDTPEWLAWDAGTFIRENVKYVDDPGLDRWKLPWETIRDGCGDCEDFACLLISIVGYMGIDAVMVISMNHAYAAVATDGYDDYTVEYEGKTYRCIDPLALDLPGKKGYDVAYVMPPRICLINILGFLLAAGVAALAMSGVMTAMRRE